MNEAEKLLGRETYLLAEKQAKNNATNPEVAAEVESRLQALIEAGKTEKGAETERVARAAIEGRFFQQLEEGGVCMDDVTPFDK